MEYQYKPYEERTVDQQYKELIHEVMLKGKKGPSRMTNKHNNEIDTIRLMGASTIRFNILENGVPFITERSIESFWQSPIGELFAFINGARTQAELEAFGCTWWKKWATEKKCNKRGLETGDLGPGSYGAAFASFPTPDGESFDQFEEIVKQMKEHPELKTHMISPWIPYYTIRNSDHQQKVVVCPCHGWLHFDINIFAKELTMVMWQRSCDVLIGCPSNWVQYSALLLAMAEVLDLKPYEFVHMISNAHIYEDQLPWVSEIQARESEPFPTLKLVKKKKNIKDYRKEDFELSDYKSGEPIKDIPVGI